jgi:hypothetical protein
MVLPVIAVSVAQDTEKSEGFQSAHNSEKSVNLPVTHFYERETEE